MVQNKKRNKRGRFIFFNIICPLCKSRNKQKNLEANDNKSIVTDKDYLTFHNGESENNIPINLEARSTQPLPDIPVQRLKNKKKTPLIPDLLTIFNLPYYWGPMDRYEAESELKGLDDGAFLLRDSAQDEFLFSVSFNRFGRTIHARVEYHQGFYTIHQQYSGAPSLEELINHFKTINMFYHPLCIYPRLRRQPFSLQKLCLGTICSYIKYYEDAYELNVPKFVLRKLHLSNFKIPLHYSNFYNESLFTSTTNST